MIVSRLLLEMHEVYICKWHCHALIFCHVVSRCVVYRNREKTHPIELMYPQASKFLMILAPKGVDSKKPICVGHTNFPGVNVHSQHTSMCSCT